MYKHVLVIGSEVHSTGLDVSTAGRDVTVIFGDGAGAVVLGRATDDEHVLLSTHIHADGTEAEILWTEYPASARHPRISAEAMAERKHYPSMKGKKRVQARRDAHAGGDHGGHGRERPRSSPTSTW